MSVFAVIAIIALALVVLALALLVFDIGQGAVGGGRRTLARWLNETGVPTANGGHKWRPSSLERVLIGTTSGT